MHLLLPVTKRSAILTEIHPFELLFPRLDGHPKELAL
jgi:hypothetical protein